MKYLLADVANFFSRARYIAQGDDLEMKTSMTLHILLSSLKRAQELFNADKVIYCLEGRSWRKDLYTRYKRNRTEARAALSSKEQEEDRAFWDTLDKFNQFIIERSGATVLQHKQCEAAAHRLKEGTRVTVTAPLVGMRLVARNASHIHVINQPQEAVA